MENLAKTPLIGLFVTNGLPQIVIVDDRNTFKGVFRDL